jgi:hypothetical protein
MDGARRTAMTEQNELLASLQTLLAKAGNPTAPAAAGWNQPAPAPAALVQGVGVPVKIARGRGTIRLYLWLPPECAASPQAMNAALDDLERAGIPLDVYEPRESGWQGGNFNRGWRK